MINANEIIKKFAKEFDKMSHEERELYLKQMGFEFTEKRKAEYIDPTTRTAYRKRDAVVAARKGPVVFARKEIAGLKKRKTNKRKIRIHED